MTKRPLGRLLQQTIGTREPSLSYTNTPTNIGGVMMTTPMKDTRESGVSELLRETHKKENVINSESVEPVYVPYEPTGGKRQEVNKGKQNKKRNKRKKKQPKKNYRNKK